MGDVSGGCHRCILKSKSQMSGFTCTYVQFAHLCAFVRWGYFVGASLFMCLCYHDVGTPIIHP